MFSRFFTILTVILILLILVGAGYIFFTLFGGKIGVNLNISYNYQWENLDPSSFTFDPILKAFYITDLSTSTIKKYSLSEDKINFTDSLGKQGNNVGQFRQPMDILVDKNNFIYVLD
ncbi:MAG: hypothetical protein ACK4GJ_06365, partial [bacterium]